MIRLTKHEHIAMSNRKSNDCLIKIKFKLSATGTETETYRSIKQSTISTYKQSTHNMNLSKSIQLSAALLLITATSSASAAHVQCNTHDDIGACPSSKMSYVCEDGQNMCCTWSNLPPVRNQRMQRRVDDMTSEIDLPNMVIANVTRTLGNSLLRMETRSIRIISMIP